MLLVARLAVVHTLPAGLPARLQGQPPTLTAGIQCTPPPPCPAQCHHGGAVWRAGAAGGGVPCCGARCVGWAHQGRQGRVALPVRRTHARPLEPPPSLPAGTAYLGYSAQASKHSRCVQGVHWVAWAGLQFCSARGFARLACGHKLRFTLRLEPLAPRRHPFFASANRSGGPTKGDIQVRPGLGWVGRFRLAPSAEAPACPVASLLPHLPALPSSPRSHPPVPSSRHAVLCPST